MSITQSLNNLPPKTRRIVLSITAFALVIGVSFFVTNLTERKASRVPRANKPEVTVVSPQRATGLEQYGARFEGMERSFKDMNQSFERRLAMLEEGKKSVPEGAPGEGGFPRVTEPSVPPLEPATSVFDAPAAKAPSLPPPPPVSPVATSIPTPSPALQGVQAPAVPSVEPTKAEPSSLPSIRLLGEGGEMDEQKAEQKLNTGGDAKPRRKRDNETAYIPGGSMFPGVMLNGMDAPTSAVSQKNPTPVVIRVKKEAVLPNYASIDVRECFVMAAGFGQLASERALIRTESIACVRHDGKVFDTKLEAYVVGTDGKVGIPGRLVSKQGQMIAKSLLAGALGGIGQSLTRSKVPNININPGQDANLYEQDSISAIAQGGLAGGISSATNMVAKFYLEMAKETFPVVETQAGQVATVIVTRGMTLPLKGSTSLERYAEPSGQNGSRLLSARNQRDEDDENGGGPSTQQAAKPPASTNVATQIGNSAQPPTVVGSHQVPVSIPGVTSPANKPSGKAQW